MSTINIMSELDEYKQNIPENLYIQLANLLKEKHISQISICQHTQNSRISECLRIIYRPLYETILEKYIEKIPFKDYYILIEEDNIDTYDDDIEDIKEIINQYILDSLPIEAFKEIIDLEGGIEYGYNRMKKYLEDYFDKYIEDTFKKYSELKQLRIIAEYVMDFLIFEYEYVDYDEIPSTIEEEAIELKSLLKTLKETYSIYIKNNLNKKNN